jgi:hypothetical protein
VAAWDTAIIAMFTALGNSAANAAYEALITDARGAAARDEVFFSPEAEDSEDEGGEATAGGMQRTIDLRTSVDSSVLGCARSQTPMCAALKQLLSDFKRKERCGSC